jgi:Family of unknown function (DUF6350)
MSLPVNRGNTLDHGKMADLPTRPSIRDRLPCSELRTAVIVGAVAALWAAGAGTLLGTVAAWAVRAIAGEAVNPLATVESGLAGWLYAHGAGVSTPAGRIALVPMGFPLLVGWLTFRGMRSAVYGASLTGGRALAMAAAAATGTYSAVAGLAVLGLRLLDGPRVGGWPAAAGAFVLSSVAAPLGAVAGSGRRPRDMVTWLARRLDVYAQSAGRAGAAALGALVAGGALVFGFAQLTHLSRSGLLFERLANGGADLIPMLLLCLALVPNAAVCGLAYSVGSGFAVGGDTAVTPWISDLGATPALPILGALPDAGLPPRPMGLVLLIPMAAGVAGGVVIVRRHPAIALRTGAFTALAAGGLVGCAVFVLALLAGGPLASGRLATVGPSAWRTAVAAVIEVSLSAAATVAVWTWIRRRADRGPTGLHHLPGYRGGP